jgi:ribokinase
MRCASAVDRTESASPVEGSHRAAHRADYTDVRVARLELLTVGDAFQDLIFMGLPRLPRLGEELKTGRFVATIGGGAVITAAAAARLGARTGIVSALSDDAVRVLRAARVSVVNVKRPSEPHAVTAALSTQRDRSFVTFAGVNDRLEPRLPGAVARSRAAHVHFAFAPVHCGRWTRLADRLRARGTTTSWDFGWEPTLRRRVGFARLLRSADVIFVNEAEAALYAGRARPSAAADFWRRSARNTVVKLGRRGSRWIARGTDIRAAATRVHAVDTTGAGDAFNGGFLFAFLRGAPPRECLRAGNFVGGHSTRAAGGIASLPTNLYRAIRPAASARSAGPARSARPARP